MSLVDNILGVVLDRLLLAEAVAAGLLSVLIINCRSQWCVVGHWVCVSGPGWPDLCSRCWYTLQEQQPVGVVHLVSYNGWLSCMTMLAC